MRGAYTTPFVFAKGRKEFFGRMPAAWSGTDGELRMGTAGVISVLWRRVSLAGRAPTRIFA